MFDGYTGSVALRALFNLCCRMGGFQPPFLWLAYSLCTYRLCRPFRAHIRWDSDTGGYARGARSTPGYPMSPLRGSGASDFELMGFLFRLMGFLFRLMGFLFELMGFLFELMGFLLRELCRLLFVLRVRHVFVRWH